MIAKPNFRRIDTATAKLDAAIEARKSTVADDGVILVQASTLTPEAVAWLWLHWLALGKFHVLAGPPGQGKTTIALACAATVSAGGRWPDGSPCAKGNVLIWSGEDDPRDTLLPRLIAWGADVSRVYFIEGTRIDNKPEPFDPARGVGAFFVARAQAHGLITRSLTGDIIAFSPPLIITEAEIDTMMDRAELALADTLEWVQST